MKVAAIELRRLDLPLVVPFRTAEGTQRGRDVLLVRVMGDGSEGWGECVAPVEPTYTSEFVDEAHRVIATHLAPRLLAVDGITATEVEAALAPVKGHRMAKAALEAAVLDAELRASGTSLREHLGGVRTSVDAGVAVGITDSIGDLLDLVEGYLSDGYKRVKLKIQPGWDVEPVRAVRQRWGDALLQVDANGSYSIEDAEHLAQLDAFDLLLIEQPFVEDDMVGHAALASSLRTPICLDESIESVRDAATAIAMGACAIVNIKPGRVGGLLEARRIHDLCEANGVPVWCGGMLETGIGRAANVALATLPNFTLPGDLSASDRYYRQDVTEPLVLEAGQLRVPPGPGIGVTPIPEVLSALTTRVETLRPFG